MTYTIYRLPLEHNNRFMHHTWAMRHGGVHLNEYNAVYTGVIEAHADVQRTLEAIYVLLNENHPADYNIPSLSVSDIVELEGIGTFFCDSVGFKRLDCERRITMTDTITHRFDSTEREYILDRGWHINDDGLLELTRAQFSKAPYAGCSYEDMKKHTLMIPSLHGVTLLYEDKHFIIVK